MPPKHDDISSEDDDTQQHPMQADEDMEVSDQESIVSNANAHGDQDMEEGGGAQTD